MNDHVPVPELPETLGLAHDFFEQPRSLLAQAISDGIMPGAVYYVALQGAVVAQGALGQRALQPHPEPMTFDTLFDLASLTKVLATVPLAFKLLEDGVMHLQEPLGAVFPEFKGRPVGAATLHDLLCHRTGLMPSVSLAGADSAAQVRQRIAEQPLSAPVGTAVIYSDLGFILLGQWLEMRGQMPLDELFRTYIAKPLGLLDTSFRPPQGRIYAATEADASGVMRAGRVHDPNAEALGGVAGHAGLFGSALDLGLFGAMLLGGGELRGRRLLTESSVSQMRQGVAETGRTLGFVDLGRGTGFAGRLGRSGTFGHTGFTGTSIVLDPAHGLCVVLLSNRVHPDRHDDGRFAAFRPSWHEAVARSLGLL